MEATAGWRDETAVGLAGARVRPNLARPLLKYRSLGAGK
jgi:hypothetical protein